MAGRYEDEREWRERELRRRQEERYDAMGRNDERYSGREGRSFDRNERVFGERESGVSYNRPQRASGNWQDENYSGVSPAMQRGDYDTGYRSSPRFSNTDYTREGGRDAEGRRFGSYEADQRWAREMRRPGPSGPYSGGTGGYDYERGYGDGGRDMGSERGGDLEDRAHDAGEFFRRTGRRISNWFSDVAGEGSEDRNLGEDRRRYEEFRGARGRGPKGYQRSDERINDEVHQRLTDDHWLDATEINCTVANGEVTLTGTVESREAKHRAERIVEDLSGVKHVQNNLRIQPGGYGASAGGQSATGSYGQGMREAGMGSSEPVRDVTDGNATPPAQKRN